MSIVKLKPETDLQLYYLSNDKEYVAEVLKRKFGTWYKIKCDDGQFR